MSKKISFKEKHVARPPHGTRWVWHTADLLTADKWRRMTLMCRRLLERIEIEHLAHSGLENGRLKIAYSQFVEWGISRRAIPAAIDYAVRAGFLEVIKRGYHLRDTTNEYRLTYFATREPVRGAVEWSAPTNEWKRLAGKSFFSRAECDTHLGQNVTLTETAEPAELAESLDADLGQNVTLSNYIYRDPGPPTPRHRLQVPDGAVPLSTPPSEEDKKSGAAPNSTENVSDAQSNPTTARTAGGRL